MSQARRADHTGPVMAWCHASFSRERECEYGCGTAGVRWHRDVLARRHAARSRPRRPGRPRTVRSIPLLVLRLARENPCWGYRRIHGEILVLGIRIAASTVWEILRQAGIDQAPERTWIQCLPRHGAVRSTVTD